MAHLKLIGMDDAGAFAVGNVVSNDTDAKLSLPSNLTPREAELIVNARVAMDPAVLEAEVKKVVAAECAKVGCQRRVPHLPEPAARPPGADASICGGEEVTTHLVASGRKRVYLGGKRDEIGFQVVGKWSGK